MKEVAVVMFGKCITMVTIRNSCPLHLSVVHEYMISDSAYNLNFASLFFNVKLPDFIGCMNCIFDCVCKGDIPNNMLENIVYNNWHANSSLCFEFLVCAEAWVAANSRWDPHNHLAHEVQNQRIYLSILSKETNVLN